MIQRREFITLLGGAAAWPLAARAQQRNRVRRIGVFLGGVFERSDPLASPSFSAFTRALAGLGWTDGRNVRMEVRWGGGDINRIRALARELVGLQPDIILTATEDVTAVVQRETRTIPIVFAAATDPVALRIVERLDRPSGTPPASPTWKPRSEASGLSCSRRLRRSLSGPQSCLIPIRPRCIMCPHLRQLPGHVRSCQS